ncbi:MAG TPA: hypothetical protein VFM94_10885, partial [Solirubrobacterales bacterium]|nr:hypothetical protein [Solirubrobacterales bacterium]
MRRWAFKSYFRVVLSAGLLLCTMSASADLAVAAPDELWTVCDSGSVKCNVPRGLDGDPTSGHIVVADQNNFRIVEFTASGQFVKAWGWDVIEAGPGNTGAGFEICIPSEGDICKAGISGDGAGQINGAQGIAVDSSSNIYLVDRNNRRVQKFDPDGNFLLTWGGGVVTGGATGTGDVALGSTQVTNVQTTSKAFMVGQRIEGAGIPAETTIVAVGEGTMILSQPSSATNMGIALSAPEGTGNTPRNEVQTFTLNPGVSSGNFKLRFSVPNPSASNLTTENIPFNASAGEVEAALAALTNIGSGNVSVSSPSAGGGVEPGGPYTIEFKGARFADTNVSQLVRQNGSPNINAGATIATGQNGASSPEICQIAAQCQTAYEGTTNGQFGSWAVGSFIAIDPADKIYVGDQNRIQRFTTSGVYQSEISVPGENVQGLAADSSGNIYAIFNGKPVVQKYSPSGEPIPPTFEFSPPGGIPTAVTVDPTGDVYLFGPTFFEGEQQDPICKLSSAGTLIECFGKEEFTASTGLATNLCPGNEVPGNLYVSNADVAFPFDDNFVRAYGTPPTKCGKAITGEAINIAKTGATLSGEANPKGDPVSKCSFEYGTTLTYGSSAPCEESSGEIGTGEEPVPVHADIAGL